MTIKLSGHILKILDLQPNCTVAKLKRKLVEVKIGSFNIFHSEESKNEILHIALKGCEDKVEILNPISRIETWCYHEISNDAQEIAEVVHIPTCSSDEQPNDVSIPPTTAENLIVRAWHLSEEIIDGKKNLVNNKIVILWRKGKYENFSEAQRKALYALLHVSGSEASSMCDEKWWKERQKVTNIVLGDGCLLEAKDATDLVLFEAAFGEIAIRWRFLSLYRILERGYLKSILQKINQEFMKSPKETVNDASHKLNEEYTRFVSLVEDRDMNSFFEDFATCIESLADSRNRYAIMLKREMSEKELGEDSKSKNGVRMCYKVRCSIVHASASALVIEEFPDADDALRSLVIPLEKAVIQYAGITTI